MKLKALAMGVAMAVAAPLAVAADSGLYGAVDFGKTTAKGICVDAAAWGYPR